MFVINLVKLTGIPLEMDPLSLRTSLANIHHINPMLCGDLLLQGMAKGLYVTDRAIPFFKE